MKIYKYFLIHLILFVASQNLFSQLDSVYYKGPSQGSISGGVIQTTDNFSSIIPSSGEEGKIITQGNSQELAEDPSVAKAYLGMA